ncbi:MAG TPA: SRPBCC family protein, partial [Pilimelia sp.]|nr:SRPBCC family protein [Pilimelia sp.]
MYAHIGRYVAAATLAGYGCLYVLGRLAGSTARERRAALPGDALVPRPNAVTNHAITVDAPPEAVWPWLAQLGWHLGGYYTPRWVDRLLFPRNWASLDHLDPALVRDLHVGDIIPDGPPGTAWYVVAAVDAPHHLVLHSTTHVPQRWRAKFGTMIDWTWTFHLTPLPARRSRLHLRVRGRTAPWWLTASYHAAIVPSDYVMAGGMLRGIR